MDSLLYSRQGINMLLQSHLCDSRIKLPLFSSTGQSKSIRFSNMRFRVRSSKVAISSGRKRLVQKARGCVKVTNAFDRRAQESVLEEEFPQMYEISPSVKVSQGLPFPLGASELESGINFAIFSQHATAVTLCLSLPEREKLEGTDARVLELELDPRTNKTGDIWHICVEDLPRLGVLYGYRMDGPQGWQQGHRFDNNVLLLDPYAKLVEGRNFFGDVSNKMCKFLGTYDFTTLPFDWGENYKLPNIPEKDLIIYEMNVRSFTADESSGLDPDIRGSYLGVIEKNDVTWHEDNWGNYESKFLAFTLHDSNLGGDIYLAFNAHDFFVKASLPSPPHKKRWFRVVDTNLESPDDFISEGIPGIGDTYNIAPYSSIILEAKP